MNTQDAAALPAPLTPEDCNLQDFAFMPLDVARLRDSDMASEQTPEENWAAVMLWAAAWHQVPAGSIPDSDNWIAKAAGYMSRGRIDPHWKEVKAGAMRGFILCSDGRWYHQVVSEKANESWVGKLKQRLKTECARIKKHNDRHKTSIPFPDFDAWFAAGCPVGQPLPVPGDKPPLSQGTGLDVPKYSAPMSPVTQPLVPSETPSKGQREGQGQGQLTSKSQSSSQASTEVGADQGHDDDDRSPSAKRAAAIVALLRDDSIEATVGHDCVLAWAADTRISRDILTLAITRAKKWKPNEVIPLAYLDKTVQTILQEQAASSTSAAPPAPSRKPQGLDPKGTDESYDDWQARVEAYERAQRGRAA